MAAAKHLLVTGAVQGVGYRASFEAQARTLKLAGWVRNRRDGSVEAIVAGSDDAIARIIAWARHGPDAARVAQVVVSEAPDQSSAPGVFEVWPTA